MSLSPSGKILATGESGEQSDIIVWDIPFRKMAFRFSEHNGGINTLEVSHDDRLLFSCGNPSKDKKMIIWDLFTGNIVTSGTMNAPVKAVAWGGMIKDIKKRDTGAYMLVTAGDRKLTLWSIDP
jgi:WD40 repeat protein